MQVILSQRAAGTRIQGILNGNREGCNGPSLEQRQDEAKKSQLKRAKGLGEGLIQEDLREEDRAGDQTREPVLTRTIETTQVSSIKVLTRQGLGGGRFRSTPKRLLHQVLLSRLSKGLSIFIIVNSKS